MKTILILGAIGNLSRILMAEVADEAGSASGAAETTGTKIRPNMENYQTAKSASGSSTKICGDAVSVALVGATLDETYGFVAKVVGTPEADLRAKYGDKNLGQQRMFLGNLIRGASASKDAEKKARVETAFAAELPAFRTAIDVRAAELQKTKDAEKQAKAEAKAKEAELKAAEKAKAAEQRKQDAEKKSADKAAAKAAEQATTKPGAGAQPAKTTQAKGPGAPSQPE